MKKRFLSLALVAMLAFALVGAYGCSTDKPAEPTTPADSSKATVDEVKKALTDKSAVVLDARANASFAGWKTAGNSMAGHIDGASDFSANWLTSAYDDKENNESMTRDEVLALSMKNKGITAESSLIIYDENGTDAATVAEYLKGKGVKNIKTFDLKEWTGELVSYPDFALWVPAGALKDLVDGKEVAELPGLSKPVILDVRWGKVEESGYLDGHIPGAISVNSDDFDDEDKAYIMDSDAKQFELAKKLGITTKSFVVLTGDPIFSARYATILKYLGVENVYVMAGNLSAWTDAGYEFETTKNDPVAVADFGATAPVNPDFIDTVTEVQGLLKDANFQLVDNRREEEYKGETSGYSYFKEAGRIEGAIYGYAGVGNSSSMLYYRNVDGTMRNGEEILAMWKDAGIDINKHMSFMCGGGYRAAEVLWDARALGLEKTSIFADGWCGWSLAGLPSVSGK